MQTIFILMTLSLGAMLFIWYSLKVKKHRKLQRQGIENICEVKEVITLVQQHRGLTAAWLNGENQVTAKLETIRLQVSRQMTKLSSTPVVKSERWLAFRDHWHRLLEISRKTSSDNSFEQHTMMIKNLAYLLEDTAENAHLSADYLPELSNIGYVWRELILTTENVGQSRAIGTGVATQQNCSCVDKIRLNYLIQTLTQTSESTLQNITALPQEHQTHFRLVKGATTKLKQLTQVMSSELVNTPKVTINNSQYFDLATDAMSKLNEIFDHQIRQLKYNL